MNERTNKSTPKELVISILFAIASFCFAASETVFSHKFNDETRGT